MKAARDGYRNVARKGVSRENQIASVYGTVFMKWSTNEHLRPGPYPSEPVMQVIFF